MQGESGQASCLPCIPGNFNNELGKVACKQCEIGLFLDSIKGTECRECPEGRNTAVSGQSMCSSCPAGTRKDISGLSPYQTEIMRQKGEPGTQEANPLYTCVVCPAGWAQEDQNQMSCEICSIGQFSDSGAPTCMKCDLGKYGSAPGECDDCGPGTYQDGKGETECKNCPVDTFSSEVEATSISECDMCSNERTTGTKAGAIDASFCLCKAMQLLPGETEYTGYFSLNDSAPHASGDGKCRECPQGADCTTQNGSMPVTILPKKGFWRANVTSREFLDCSKAYPGVNAKELAQQRCCPDILLGDPDDEQNQTRQFWRVDFLTEKRTGEKTTCRYWNGTSRLCQKVEEGEDVGDELIELQPVSQCFFVEGAGAGRRDPNKRLNESLVASWKPDNQCFRGYKGEFLRATGRFRRDNICFWLKPWKLFY
jgi:hypothetical protein